MGNFGHHLTGSVIAGGACGFAAATVFHTPLVDAGACALLCGFGGILPDVDSPMSRPTQMVVNTSSVLAPVFALQALGDYKLTTSEIFLVAIFSYVFARYGVREFIKRTTVHRGIIHSIPMAFIWGAVVCLVYHRAPALIQNLTAASATIGFITHLVIDEMFSLVDINGGRFMPKRSFGTALKFFSNSIIANLIIYGCLALLLYWCGMESGMIKKM